MTKLIIGLGNPGPQYEKTRHNAGFIAIDMLLEVYGFENDSKDFKGIIYTSRIKGQKVIFVKPQTFMNLSGECIIQIMNYFKINIEDTLIIYDDKDLLMGHLRFRSNGSAGGHNGIKNIIQHFKTENFKRLRIGVGSPTPGYKIVDWVLSKMNNNEISIIKNNIKSIANFVIEFIEGVTFTNLMNKYN